MATLSIYLFGPPRIVLNGGEIYVRRRKGVALLAYLAVTQQPQSRDTLATLFWPDLDQTDARDNLRRTLSELHQALDRDWLAIDRTTVRLREDAEPWADLWQFHQLLAACQQHGHANDQICPDCLPRLQQAAALYRDDFLAGFTLADSPTFDEWQAQTTAEIRATFAATLARLVDAHVAQHDYAKAIDHARRWVALDPLHEPAQRQLMELYAGSNQRNAALRQYEEYCQILASELGVAPAHETVALYEQIRNQKVGPEESVMRTVAVRQRPFHNLPTQTTSFIGRTEEVAEIQKLLLDRSSCRLLNLVGPGGIGKTRLALAAAAQMTDAFPEGIFFVSLASVSETTDIVPTIAEALRFTFYGSRDLKEQLLGYLSQKHLLLLLDNFEHLLAGTELLAAILVQAPAVTLLTTARERLQLQEEWVYEVQGLTFPTHARQGVTAEKEMEYLASYSAVQLFIQRARQVMPNIDLPAPEMAAIVRICQLVGGMPLGIELAASWMRTLSGAEIATEIGRSFNFLATSLHNVPEHHRSLRAVFEQTWGRLAPTEQGALMNLSIFRGGCTREAAVAVTGATLLVLSSLVDKALLRRTNTGRYALHELIRQFAEMQLQADPAADVQAQDRHAAYFTAFLLEREIYLKGMDQQAALAEIEADSDNIRRAWRWAVRQHQIEYVNRAICSLGLFYRWRGGYKEGEAEFRGAANEFNDHSQALARSSPARLVSAKLFMWQGVFTSKVKHVNQARQLFQQSLEILDSLEPADLDTQLAKADALLELGFMSNGKEARRLYEQSLALYQALDNKWGMASVLQNLGLILSGVLGDYEQGRQAFEESIQLRQSLGDQRGTARLFLALSSAAIDQEKFEEAERLVRQGVMICQEVGLLQDLASSFRQWGELLLRQGKFVESRGRFEESATIYHDLGNQRGEIISRLAAGEANLHLGQYEQVRALARLTVPISQHLLFREGFFSLLLGCLALIDNDLSRAETLLQESVLAGREFGRLYLGWALACQGYAKCLLGELTAAKQILLEALTIGVDIRAFLPLATALPAVALLKVAQGEMKHAIEIFAVASRYPYIANSRWFENVVGHRMTVAVGNLPQDVVIAAQTQGQTRDLWVTAAELIRELDDRPSHRDRQNYGAEPMSG